ncbi:MAG: hypothetical protein ACXVBW_02430, partial [Bdellovibrionota bacterium]
MVRWIALAAFLGLTACSVDSAKNHYVLAEKLWSDRKYQASVSEFEKVTAKDPHGKLGLQALYRAAKLNWKANDGLKEELSVQILRAETFEKGPYKELDVTKLVPGKTAYEYVDKSMGTESKYHYKLTIKETGESFGPV